MTGTDERTINDANDRDEASASMRDDDDSRRRTLFRSNRRRGTTIGRSQYVAMATVACYCLLLTSRIAAADDDIPPSLRRGSTGAASSYPSRQRQRRRLSKYCPGTYSGKAPTKKCGGYVTCSSGEASSSSFACAGGTSFDVRTGTCTWPDAVNCKTGEDLLEQLGIGDDDDDDDGGGRDNGDGGGGGNKSRYCPERYTGRAPTANCGGYVDCNRGVEGLEATCPPETAFDSVAQQCVYDLEGCEMLVGENPPNAKNGDYLGENPLDRFCPEDYSGRAPMQDCEGFVDCRNGEARRSKKCPGSTMYDVMTLTCAYSLSGCDALPGMEPTVSPATQMELMSEEKGGDDNDDDDGGGEEVTGCPDGHTGYLALPGCASYLYCAAGAELSRIKCGDGTLFDERGGYCNWADQVSCDSTASPSDRPTLNPTFLPTADPTLGPVTLDEMGVVYYPVFSDGTCSDDGNFPPDVGRQYLFADAQSCCSRYFPTNMVECRRATAPSPPPTPTAGREWYPDYDNDVCRNDGQAGEFETNFFFTYVECCNFDWIDDKVACLRAEPTVAYYPDYDTDSCRNDGRQSPYENNIFGSLEDCCRFQWIDYGLCITGGRDAGKGNGNGQGGTMVMVPMDAEPEVVAEFYPDYTNDVCKCDGKQSDFEVNIFPTYQDCCLFDLIHTSTCRMHEAFQLEKCVHLDNDQPPAPSHSKPKQPPAPATWYPDMEGGLCRNDGNDPGGFVLATSALICCKRFMSLIQKECRARSKQGSTMTPLLGDGGGDGGSPDDDDEDPCPALKAARRCKGNASCRWDGTNGRCVAIAAAAAPTPRPTPMRLTPNENASWVKPGAAADADEADDCSKENKKQCLKNSDRCTYDASAKTCRRNLTAAPVPSPTDLPTLPAAPAPYYPDYVIHACRNDGEHLVGDVLYDDNTECCKSEGMNWRTCMKYAKGKMTLGEKESRADVVGNPYYPDYFNSVCRNDGRQSPLEENLFDTIWECCQMEWLDRDSCMADAGGG